MTSSTRSIEENRIRERVETWAKALYAKDLDTLMALYAPEMITFDLMPPSQVDGVDRYRKNFERWFISMPGPIAYNVENLHVFANNEVGFCYYLSHIQAKRANGEKADYWVRVTVGFEKRRGKWLIVHDHISMPFDMETMKATPELKLEKTN